MCYIVIVTSIIAILSIVLLQILDSKWRKKPLRNFSLRHRGLTFWVSRSVAVTLLTTCKNEDGTLCVLANKRGSGTPDFQGYWNIPCGYLDYDESGEEAAQRETFEETGVFVNTNDISLLGLNTSPKANKQNVTIRYMASLNGNINDYKFDTSKSEYNEVSEVKWIPVTEISNYKWAFNHEEIIKNALNLEV